MKSFREDEVGGIRNLPSDDEAVVLLKMAAKWTLHFQQLDSFNFC